MTNEDFYSARVDHRISDKDSLFGSMQWDKADLLLPDTLGNVLIPAHTRRALVSVEETHVFSPQLVNTFRAGYNRSFASNDDFKAISPLMTDPALAAVPGQFAPQILVSGLTSFAGGLNAVSTDKLILNAFQLYDDVFFIKGKHSFKFGFSGERDQGNRYKVITPGGQFNFNSLSAFLKNQPRTFTSGLPGLSTPRYNRQSIIGAYFQDDFRLRPNLTLNIGLRYEMSTVPTENSGKLVNLLNITDAAPHLGSPLFANPTLRNLEPRVPFGNGKTVDPRRFWDIRCTPSAVSVLHHPDKLRPLLQDGDDKQPGSRNVPNRGLPPTHRSDWPPGSNAY